MADLLVFTFGVAAVAIIFTYKEMANHHAYFILLDRMPAMRVSLAQKGLTLTIIHAEDGRPATNRFQLTGEDIYLNHSPRKMLQIINGVQEKQIWLIHLQMMSEEQALLESQ